jgi:hypothetical protein
MGAYVVGTPAAGMFKASFPIWMNAPVEKIVVVMSLF